MQLFSCSVLDHADEKEGLNYPVDISGTVVGESPDFLLLSGTVVGENRVCWVLGQRILMALNV